MPSLGHFYALSITAGFLFALGCSELKTGSSTMEVAEGGVDEPDGSQAQDGCAVGRILVGTQCVNAGGGSGGQAGGGGAGGDGAATDAGPNTGDGATGDVEAPDTELTSTPPALDNSTTVRFEFGSPSADVAGFECAIDFEFFVDCTSPHEVSGLDSGTHEFEVRAIDTAGNVDSTSAIYTWVVDLSSPNARIVEAPEGLVSTSSFDILFESDQAGDSPRFECSLDGAAFAACTSPLELRGLSDGEHVLEVTVYDDAGNTDPTPAQRGWTVDSSAPSVSITSPASGAALGPYVVLDVSVDDPNATTTCRRDGGDEEPCAHGQGLFFGEGSRSLEVIATDEAGNRGSNTVTFSVDCVDPAPLGNAILRLSFEESAVAQELANGANAGSPATRGDSAGVDARDPATSPSGRYGQALRFARDELDVAEWGDPVGESNHAAWTIEAWVRPTALPSNAPPVFVYRQGGGNLHLSYSSYDGAASFFLAFYNFDDGITATVAADPVAYDAWHHTLAVYDGTTLRLYVDGVQYSAAESTQAGGRLSFYWMFIGAGDASSSQSSTIDGWLDELTISTAALSPADARARYCPYP